MNLIIVVAYVLGSIFLWSAIGLFIVIMFNRYHDRKPTRQKPDWWKWSVTPFLLFISGPLFWCLAWERRREYKNLERNPTNES